MLYTRYLLFNGCVHFAALSLARDDDSQLQKSLLDADEEIKVDRDEICFGDGALASGRTQEGCCGDNGAWVHPMCWMPPFHHFVTFCCDPSQIKLLEQRLHAQLLQLFAGRDARSLNADVLLDQVRQMASDVRQFLRSRHMEAGVAMPLEWLKQLPRTQDNSSTKVSVQPFVVVVHLLWALEDSAFAVRKAFALFLEYSLSFWVRSGWPVFALLELVWRRLCPRCLAAEGDLPAGSLQQQSVCLLGCKGLPAWTSLCPVACASAAASLPPAKELQLQTRVVTEAFQLRLLEHAGEALLAQGSRAFVEQGQHGLWRIFHQLQDHASLTAGCPTGFSRVKANAVPAYHMCLPLKGGPAGPADEYMLDRIIGLGRWMDCDALRPLAASVGLLEFGEVVQATAVDVGSNIGACTGYLLALGFQVHAIDPVPLHRDILLGSAWPDIEAGRLLVHCAFVSDETSTQGEHTTNCPQVRLDELLGKVDGPLILKIDVEGAELSVLRGSKGLLAQRRVKAVLLELHTELLRRRGLESWSCLSLLLSAGFIVQVVPQYFHDHYVPVSITSQEDFDAVLEDWHQEEGPNLQIFAKLAQE